jgi:riboflavin kinase/FMN adenylyltransferase
LDILNGIDDIKPRHKGGVVTIGNFDGVHTGHQKIFKSALEEAQKLKAKSLAITFEPHPMKVLRPERDVKTLTPPEEKARLMKHYGIDAVLFIVFDRDFASMPAEDFIKDILVEKLAARMVIVGHNYAFGKGKKGTTDLLRRRGEKFGFTAKVVRHAAIEGNAVSSSRIRSLLGWGRVFEAAAYLGRPYSIEGTVVEGHGRGAKLLDTPTANITTPNELAPKEGVYAVRVSKGGSVLDGVANIGTNPTFGNTEPSYEVHIFDFKGDLKGERIKIHFIERLRDEVRFPDVDALHAQIEADIAKAKKVLSKSRLRPI